MRRFCTDLNKFWIRTIRRIFIEILVLVFTIFAVSFQSLLQLPTWGSRLLIGAVATYFVVGILMLPGAVRAARAYCIELDHDSLVIRTHKSFCRIPYKSICIDTVTMRNHTVSRFIIRSDNIGKIRFETLKDLDALYSCLRSVGVALCGEHGERKAPSNHERIEKIQTNDWLGSGKGVRGKGVGDN